MIVATFGEIMLRLKSPGNERLFQSPTLEATFGGGEANVAVSLSLLGQPSRFITAVPANPVGSAALQSVARYGVDTSHAKAVKQSRLGIYFLETGANQRASTVVYDRDPSAISTLDSAQWDWPTLFQGCGWLHITGITPALSESAATAAKEALTQARALGLTISMDLNYRKKLWNYGKSAVSVMSDLAKLCHVIIANEEDIQMCLGIEPDASAAHAVNVPQGQVHAEAYRALTQKVKAAYPNVHTVAVTLRSSISADHNRWSAVVNGPQGFFQAPEYDITDIVDRVGGGDSFSAGLIFGLIQWPQDQAKALAFATAASCLKHSIPGDFNLSTRAEVEALMGGDGSGRVQR